MNPTRCCGATLQDSMLMLAAWLFGTTSLTEIDNLLVAFVFYFALEEITVVLMQHYSRHIYLETSPHLPGQ